MNNSQSYNIIHLILPSPSNSDALAYKVLKVDSTSLFLSNEKLSLITMLGFLRG